MKPLKNYLKGILILLVIILALILVGIFYLGYDLIYGAVVVLLLITSVLILPYFIGKDYEKEKPGNYEVRKVK